MIRKLVVTSVITMVIGIIIYGLTWLGIKSENEVDEPSFVGS